MRGQPAAHSGIPAQGDMNDAFAQASFYKAQQARANGMLAVSNPYKPPLAHMEWNKMVGASSRNSREVVDEAFTKRQGCCENEDPVAQGLGSTNPYKSSKRVHRTNIVLDSLTSKEGASCFPFLIQFEMQR